MPLEVQETRLFRLSQELLIQACVRQGERHVHQGAARQFHRVGIEIGAIDGRIQLLRLAAIYSSHRLEAAQVHQPIEYQPREVQRKTYSSPRQKERRALILQSVRQMISDRGYEAVTMKSLASTSGVSVKTLYTVRE